MFFSFRRLAILAGAMILWTNLAAAQQQKGQDFQVWLQAFRQEAAQKGISQRTINATLSNVTRLDRVIELDRKQPEFSMLFEQYKARVINRQRIEKGRALLAENRVILDQISARYGVPPQFIVALWGMESDFGRLMGDFSVVNALATLAHDGRRSQYFRGELLNVLKIVESGRAAPSDMKGSWAGAMGQCQFMPSTFLSYAVDWRGDGRADIWRDREDVFASAANYLSKAGWKAGQGWGRAVRLPENGIAASLFGPDAKRSVSEWGRLGLRTIDGQLLPQSAMKATLIRAETGRGKDKNVGAPYLVYDNYHVFMKWNRSVFFALAAGTLADAIAGD